MTRAKWWKSTRRTMERQDGYSLLGIALLLIVVGLMVHPGLHLVKIWREYSNSTETAERMTAAQDAVKAFVMENGRYPCPAPLNAPIDSARFGREVSDDCTDGDHAGTFRSAGRDGRMVRTGTLPVRTLGLRDEWIVDGWNHRFTYAVTEEFAAEGAPLAADRGAITIVDGAGNAASASEGNVVHLILAHGPDRRGAYNLGGAPQEPCDPDAFAGENCTHNARYVNTLARSNQAIGDGFTHRLVFDASMESYAWNAGPWDACDGDCGEGLQDREVVCRSSAGETVDDALCSGPAPTASRKCSLDPCPVLPAGTLAAGKDTNCAIAHGKVYCWGRHTDPNEPPRSRPGFGTTLVMQTGGERQSQAIAKDLPVAASRVVTSGYHSCAIAVDSRVWCWGSNQFGQLGDGTTADSVEPVMVHGLEGVIDIDVPNTEPAVYTCALKSDGSVWCWGQGALGNGHSSSQSSVPLRVQNLQNATEISVGPNHSCARREDSTVWCWGSNTSWQVGATANRNDRFQIGGTATQIGGPGQSFDLSGVKQVAVGPGTSCAVKEDKTVWCWGARLFPDNIDCLGCTHDAEPVRAPPIIVEPEISACHFSFDGRRNTNYCCAGCPNRSHSRGCSQCAVIGDAAKPPPGSHPTNDSNLTNITEIDIGRWHACALTDGGEVWCWGSNANGKLGVEPGSLPGSSTSVNGVFSRSYLDPVATPAVKVQGLNDVVSISLGSEYSCAEKSDGTFWCWGKNTGGGAFGETGNVCEPVCNPDADGNNRCTTVCTGGQNVPNYVPVQMKNWPPPQPIIQE
ncbi:thrombospondin type-1 domain-containing protein [Nitratireductor aquimarinus]|uniref:thrombospondin type-1 domain-containing protein n=1 Tax=Nitratireductor aquimarinus TaxID=889300 RepID=UPI00398ED8A6